MGSADPVPHAGPPKVAGVLPPESLQPAAPMDAAAAAGPSSESTGAMVPGGMVPGVGGMMPAPGGGAYGYMPLPMGGYMPPPGHPSMGTPSMGAPSMGTPNMGTPNMGMARTSQAMPAGGGGPPGPRGMGGSAAFQSRWDGSGHPGTIMMMGSTPYEGQMMPGAMVQGPGGVMMHGGMPMPGGGAMLGPPPGAMMTAGMHPMAGWGHPPTAPMVVTEPRPCWGHILSGGVSMCTPGFQGATGHFKNHFCPNCMLHGLCVEATRVRELVGDVSSTSFQNPRSHGLWATSGDITFRVINQTAKCSGAPIIITRDVRSAEQLRLPPMPDHYLQDGWLHLSISRGTLIPTANLRGGNFINRTSAQPPLHLQPARIPQTGSFAPPGHGGVSVPSVEPHAGEASGADTPPHEASPGSSPAPYPGQSDGGGEAGGEAGGAPPPMAAARGAPYPSRVGPPTPQELGYPELGGNSNGHSSSHAVSLPAAPLPAPLDEGGKAAAMGPTGMEPDPKRARTDVPAQPFSHSSLPATAGAGGEAATGTPTSGVDASTGSGLAAVRHLASAHAQLVQQLQNVLQTATGGKAQDDPAIAAYQAALANFTTGIAPLSEAVNALSGGGAAAGGMESAPPATGS